MLRRDFAPPSSLNLVLLPDSESVGLKKCENVEELRHGALVLQTCCQPFGRGSPVLDVLWIGHLTVDIFFPLQRETQGYAVFPRES